MSTWLRKQMAAWVVVSLLISTLSWGSGVSNAQNRDSQALKVVEDFYTLNLVAKVEIYSSDWRKADTGIVFSILQLISAKSRQQLGLEGTRKLLRSVKKVVDAGDTSFAAKVGNYGLNRIKVQGRVQTAPFEAVLLREKGQWKIDLIATYGEAVHLKGEALSKAVYKITGVKAVGKN